MTCWMNFLGVIVPTIALVANKAKRGSEKILINLLLKFCFIYLLV